MDYFKNNRYIYITLSNSFVIFKIIVIFINSATVFLKNTYATAGKNSFLQLFIELFLVPVPCEKRVVAPVAEILRAPNLSTSFVVCYKKKVGFGGGGGERQLETLPRAQFSLNTSQFVLDDKLQRISMIFIWEQLIQIFELFFYSLFSLFFYLLKKPKARYLEKK